MSSEAIQLKLKALELKKAGDLEGAKAALSKARTIEFESITADQLNDAGELKRLAVALKRKGDIAGAKEALIKAKRIEAGGASDTDHHPQQTTKRPSVAQQASARMPCLFSGSSKPLEADATDAIETSDPADDGRSTNYLAQTDTTVSDLREELNPSGPVTFDDDEMADIETMADLQTMGMDVPSESDYQNRIKANRVAALAAKNRGDVGSAKRLLYRSKQLEAARIELYAQKEEGSDDDEDYSLLDELNGGSNEEDDAFYAELFGAEENVLDLEHLDDFDADMLKDMMDAGMEVPNPDDIMKQAQEKKNLAVELHKDGNTVAAKSALAESKRLHGQAEQLAEMLDAIDSGGDADGDGGDMAALMAMLEGSEGSSSGEGGGARHGEAPAVAAPAASAEPIKTAAEWKKEAIRFKQEGKLTEATKALRMCKQVMAEDANKAEMEKRKQVIKELNGEIDIAKEQVKRYVFYEHFVDKHVGAAQLSFWRKYIMNCESAIRLVESKGIKAINIARSTAGGGKKILNEDLSFVCDHTDPNDERLEVAILDVLNIQENKHLKKALRHQLKEQKTDKKAALVPQDIISIRVDVTIQLPPSEKESDDNISLKFDPQPMAAGEHGDYNACHSKFVDIPRGKSRHARTVLRRMERKRIQITVAYVPAAKKGLFGVRKSKDSSHSETSLGTVVVDLKEFLSGRCVAGDFPLLDSMRRNELGGALRLGIRTGMPFDPEAVEAQAALVELTGYELAGVSAAAGTAPIDMKPYEAMTFASCK